MPDNIPINGRTVFAGVVGWPVSHSLSPAIHNRWMQENSINAVYLPLPVEPENLPSVIPALSSMGCVGVNLTIPHKEQVLPLLDHVDDVAKRIGACNTVVMKEGKLHGHNTDAYGFWKSLEQGAPALKRDKALVLGAGGAARAVITALHDAGYSEIRIMNRTYEKAQALCALSSQARAVLWGSGIDDVDLLVNTTSLGMKGQPPLEMDLSPLPSHAVVTDIVYNPLHTPLLLLAKQQGLTVVDGLGMLLYQAQKAFELWFGVTPRVDETLRKTVLEQLGQ